MSQQELINNTIAPGNQIEKAVGLGADMIAIQLINVVSNILNSQTDRTNYILEENQRVSFTKCHAIYRNLVTLDYLICGDLPVP